MEEQNRIDSETASEKKAFPLKTLEGIIDEKRKGMASGYFLKMNPRNAAYIECKFAEKETAKQMGAKWDPVKKMWYIPPGKNVQPFFEKWKTHCRKCNSILTCKIGKLRRSCEYTETGICCLWGGGCY